MRAHTASTTCPNCNTLRINLPGEYDEDVGYVACRRLNSSCGGLKLGLKRLRYCESGIPMLGVA